MKSQQTIRFDADGFTLTGTLHLPTTSNRSVIIGCHGLLADRNSPKQISLAQACNNLGFAYFRFDHRGCGHSQGDFQNVTTLESRCSDLYHAIATMQHHPDVDGVAALFGSSFGGTVVLAYAAQHQTPTLITYAAPINSTAIRHANIRDNQGKQPDTALLTDALTFDIAPQLPGIKNILIAHSQNDETVPVEHAHHIHATVGEPKKLVIFQGGDHRMSPSHHQRQFEALFVDWIKKHHREQIQ